MKTWEICLTIYLFIGGCITGWLSAEAKPSHWSRYPQMILGWPIIVYMAWRGYFDDQ